MCVYICVREKIAYRTERMTTTDTRDGTGGRDRVGLQPLTFMCPAVLHSSIVQCYNLTLIMFVLLGLTMYCEGSMRELPYHFLKTLHGNTDRR